LTYLNLCKDPIKLTCGITADV